MKTCSNPQCAQLNPQSLNAFHKLTASKDGVRNTCKKCVKRNNHVFYINNSYSVIERVKIWQRSNPERVKIHRKIDYEKNKPRKQISNTKWGIANPDKVKLIKQNWEKNNPGKVKAKTHRWNVNNRATKNFYCAGRRAAKLQRTPRWLTKDQLTEIRSFYKLAKELQWLSETPLHVDHIVPLQGDNVSGLHVPWNLQVLPASINCSKGNRFDPKNTSVKD